ncbi:hypothetical protein C484_15742 [Natrialba taiwanensis DSM 12281]|uniref:Uncharacterized protein n=2 Tax=Natrialba taiwanensis TaxID=160846 RepID=L9ZPE1_9EURY|nr:hypothetical protein C484_15742 [Natrialba taiwanensis DSM 12281]
MQCATGRANAPRRWLIAPRSEPTNRLGVNGIRTLRDSNKQYTRLLDGLADSKTDRTTPNRRRALFVKLELSRLAMSRHNHVAIAIAALVVLSVAAFPGAVAADESTDESALEIDVAQDETVTVTVTENDTVVDEMNLTVTAVDDNETYADTGTYTGVDGEFTLSPPEGNESVELAFGATVDNATVETTETVDGAAAENETPFGELVSQFVADNKNETDGPFGLAVANFVVENNPGNAPDHAGPPAHAGPGNDSEDATDRQGPPAHAGPGGDDPASGNDDSENSTAELDDEDAETVDEEQNSDDDTEDEPNGGGPPSHAGANGNNR